MTPSTHHGITLLPVHLSPGSSEEPFPPLARASGNQDTQQLTTSTEEDGSLPPPPKVAGPGVIIAAATGQTTNQSPSSPTTRTGNTVSMILQCPRQAPSHSQVHVSAHAPHFKGQYSSFYVQEVLCNLEDQHSLYVESRTKQSSFDSQTVLSFSSAVTLQLMCMCW